MFEEKFSFSQEIFLSFFEKISKRIFCYISEKLEKYWGKILDSDVTNKKNIFECKKQKIK